MESSPESHSSIQPAALACLGLSKVPGTERASSPGGSPQHRPGVRSKGRRETEEAAPVGAHLARQRRSGGRGAGAQWDWEMQMVRDEVCLDIALDVVNISPCFITDQNLGGHDQSA